MTIDKAQLRALAWYTEDYLTDRSATTYSAAMAARWMGKGWPVNPLFDDKQVDHLFAEIEKLRTELAGLRTGYDAQNNVIEDYKSGQDRYEQIIEDMKAEIKALRKALLEASEEVATWGAYASEYFQEKHDLAGCVAKLHAAAMAKEVSQ